MKKLAISLIALLILSVGINSCTKENAASQNKTAGIKLKSSGTQFQISVSGYGFLVFPTSTDFLSYANFIRSSTPEQINTYHSSIGFTSMAAINPIAQDINYCINQSGVVQIEGTVFKYDEAGAKLLSMSASILNAPNYAALSGNLFNSQIMNKFSADFDHGSSFNIFAFCQDTPFGHIDPSGDGAGNRMFGASCTDHYHCTWNPISSTYENCQTYTFCCHYFFFIQTDCGWLIAPPNGSVELNSTPN